MYTTPLCRDMILSVLGRYQICTKFLQPPNTHTTSTIHHQRGHNSTTHPLANCSCCSLPCARSSADWAYMKRQSVRRERLIMFQIRSSTMPRKKPEHRYPYINPLTAQCAGASIGRSGSVAVSVAATADPVAAQGHPEVVNAVTQV